MKHEPVFGIYLHFPFCRAKCGYCDFASEAVADIPHRQYADAVLGELEARAAYYGGRRLRSIYFGGGTPSLWDHHELGRVLGEILRRFDLASEVEVTLEANPGTVGEGAFTRFLEAGVNRLSLGLQSLDDVALRLLGRIHDSAQARQAVREARRAGFENLSGDVMFGLPSQTVAQHLEQLARVLELELGHLSVYGLSLASGAPLRRAGFLPASEDLQAEMMEEGRSLLARAGLPQYEVSSYARVARRSVHNSLVWAGQPYLGLGASAHSMFFAPHQRSSSTLRVENPELARYLTAEVNRSSLPPPMAGVEPVSSVDGALQPVPTVEGASVPAVAGARLEVVEEPRSRHELLFLGLRTVAGVDRTFYRRRFGEDLAVHGGETLLGLVDQGLLSLDADRLAPTPRGIWFADELAVRLMT